MKIEKKGKKAKKLTLCYSALYNFIESKARFLNNKLGLVT